MAHIYPQKRIAWHLFIMIKKRLATVSFVLCLLGFSAFLISFTCTTAFAGGLTDISGHWAAPEIDKAVAAGYVNGYPDGSFKPNAAVTRAELTAMIVKAFQLAGGQSGDSFKDVSNKDWFAQAVDAATTNGVASGYPDGTFRPQKAVDRQEAACMLSKLLNLKAAGELNFSDTGQISSWAVSSVSMLTDQGIISGYPDDTFRAEQSITRAEAVVVINKALAFEYTPVSDLLQPASGSVNVRSGPSLNAPKIGQVHQGDLLQANELSKDNWYQIAFQGGTGWIAGWYVQLYQPTSPSNQTPNQPPSSGQTPSPGQTPVPGQTSSTGQGLNVQVNQESTGTVVDITGAQGVYQYTEQTNPECLLVTAPGVTSVQSPSEIDVGEGGLNKIITTFPAGASGTSQTVATTGSGQSTGTAQVEIYFVALSSPIVYQVTPGAAGELLITLAPQIYQIQAVPISDFVAVSVLSTATVNFQPSQSGGQITFALSGCSLNSSLNSWQQQLNTMGVNSIQLGRNQSGAVNLTVNTAPNVSYTSGTCADGTQLVFWFQGPGAKMALLSAPNSSTLYYGMDTSPYPGDDIMQAWWNDSPFCYTGFYLGPTPYHPEAELYG